MINTTSFRHIQKKKSEICIMNLEKAEDDSHILYWDTLAASEYDFCYHKGAMVFFGQHPFHSLIAIKVLRSQRH